MCDQKIVLLNASNMDGFPVYPYAFIQVPAVARQVGIEVICKDLLGIPKESWGEVIQTLIEQYNPAMILITLRNTDSLTSQDYEQDGGGIAYFPVEDTKDLITTIRAVSDLKIAIGGFGFSVMPNDLMRYLRPDLGVIGDPNPFFEHFEEIYQENYEKVANLLFFQGTRLISNPIEIYPPHPDTEYTPQVIDEMMAFYDEFPSPGFQGAPVEIMRGCIHSCVFCSEPHVKGKQVRYRDLSAVMGDIEILVNHGITELYIITSELNPEGNGFVLELADRIHAFNELQPDDRKVTWFGANYLLGFSGDEYKRLYKSGFTGGWFDITALNDENARAMQTPYRNKNLIAHLKTHAYFKRKQAITNSKKEASGGDITIRWTMFLGNPATTIETIRKTLRVANQNGIAQLFDHCGIITNIRVFEYEEPDPDTLDVTYSVTSDLVRTGYRQIIPSFAYPPALLQEFGSEGEILGLFKYIAETYLSTKYKKTRDWFTFIKNNTDAASITRWMTALSDERGVHLPVDIKPRTNGKASQTLQRLFSEELQEEEVTIYEDLAKQVVDTLLSASLERFPDQFESFGFPASISKLERITPYELMVQIYKRVSVLSFPMQNFVRFCFQAMLYKFNIEINSKYKKLFLSDSLT
jgi:hypothetical protein